MMNHTELRKVELLIFRIDTPLIVMKENFVKSYFKRMLD